MTKEQISNAIVTGFGTYAATIALNMLLDMRPDGPELRKHFYKEYERQIIGHRMAYEAGKEDETTVNMLGNILGWSVGTDLEVYDQAIEDSMAIIKEALRVK